MVQNYTNNFLKPQILNIEINRQKKLILPKKKKIKNTCSLTLIHHSLSETTIKSKVWRFFPLVYRGTCCYRSRDKPLSYKYSPHLPNSVRITSNFEG